MAVNQSATSRGHLQDLKDGTLLSPPGKDSSRTSQTIWAFCLSPYPPPLQNYPTRTHPRVCCLLLGTYDSDTNPPTHKSPRNCPTGNGKNLIPFLFSIFRHPLILHTSTKPLLSQHPMLFRPPPANLRELLPLPSSFHIEPLASAADITRHGNLRGGAVSRLPVLIAPSNAC